MKHLMMLSLNPFSFLRLGKKTALLLLYYFLLIGILFGVATATAADHPQDATYIMNGTNVTSPTTNTTVDIMNPNVGYQREVTIHNNLLVENPELCETNTIIDQLNQNRYCDQPDYLTDQEKKQYQLYMQGMMPVVRFLFLVASITGPILYIIGVGNAPVILIEYAGYFFLILPFLIPVYRRVKYHYYY